ncbi:MAG: hypothetical protein ACERKV_04195 [Clostridiaceae bacterium]
MRLFKKKYFISFEELLTIFFFSILIFALSLVRPLFFLNYDRLEAIHNNINMCGFDFLCSFKDSGIVDFMNLILIIVPLYTVLILNITDNNSKMVRLIRFHDRKKMWKNQTSIVIFSALIITILLIGGGYLYGGIILKNFNNTWNTDYGYPYLMYGNTSVWIRLSGKLYTGKVISVFFITTFMGLSFIGTLICTLKLVLKNIYTFLIIVTIPVTDFYLVFHFTVFEQIIVTTTQWIYPNSIVKNNIYFLVGFLVFYTIGGYINLKMDQTISKEIKA